MKYLNMICLNMIKEGLKEEGCDRNFISFSQKYTRTGRLKGANFYQEKLFVLFLLTFVFYFIVCHQHIFLGLPKLRAFFSNF